MKSPLFWFLIIGASIMFYLSRHPGKIENLLTPTPTCVSQETDQIINSGRVFEHHRLTTTNSCDGTVAERYYWDFTRDGNLLLIVGIVVAFIAGRKVGTLRARI